MLYICIFSNKLDLIRATSIFAYLVEEGKAVVGADRDGEAVEVAVR
jgi:hypothetical protein